MALKYFLLLSVICSAELTEVRITSYQDLAGLVSESEGEYTVVAYNRIVVSHQRRIMVKDLNGTDVSEEIDVGYRPSKLVAYSNDDIIHIVAASHARKSSRNAISYCSHYNNRDERLICRPRESFRPPTSFVATTLADNNGVTAWAVFFDRNSGEYVARNLNAETNDPFELPEDCICSDPSSCLKPDGEPLSGGIIVECDNGISYLHNLYGEISYIPPHVKQVATSSDKPFIYIVQPVAGQFRDSLIVYNRTTDLRYAAAQPLLQRETANASDPIRIQDMAVVPVNGSSQLKVCFFIRRDGIFYFDVVDFGIFPEVHRLMLPPELTPVRIRGMYGSFIVVETTSNNGTTILVTIEVVQAEEDDSRSNSTSPSPSSQTSSHTTPTPLPTTEPTTQSTTSEETPTNSLLTADDSTNGFQSRSYVYGILTVLVPGLLILAVVLLLWRIFVVRRRKCNNVNTGSTTH